MKIRNFIVPMLIVALTAFSCGGSKKTRDDKAKMDSINVSDVDKLATEEEMKRMDAASSEESSPTATSQSEGKDDYSKMVSSSATQVSKFDSTRKLIRIADLKFRTLDVPGTSYAIEDIVKKFSGFTASTHLSSEVTHTETTRVSPDSLVEITTYHFTNEMLIRVPVQNLDTMLKCIVPMIDFLDYRNIKAEDVSFAYLRKQLEKKRLALYNLQVSTLTTTGNTGDRLAAMESQLEKQIQHDEAMIERMEMDDQVKFATVTLHLYGRDKTRHIMLSNEDEIESYKPGFGKQLLHALNRGWQVLKLFVLGLITLWPLWLVGAIIWFGIARHNKIKKSKQLPK